MFSSSVSEAALHGPVLAVDAALPPLAVWSGVMPPSFRESAKVGIRQQREDDWRRLRARERAEGGYQRAAAAGQPIDLGLYAAAWGEFGPVVVGDVFASLKKKQDAFADWLSERGGALDGAVARMLVGCRQCHLAHFHRSDGRSSGVRHRPFSSCKSPFCPTCEQARHRRMHLNVCSYVDSRWGAGFYRSITQSSIQHADVLLVTVRPRESVCIEGLRGAVEMMKRAFAAARRRRGWAGHELGWAATFHLKCVRGGETPVFVPHFHYLVEFDLRVDESFVRRVLCEYGVEVHVVRLEGVVEFAKAASYLARSAVRTGVRGAAGLERRASRSVDDLIDHDRWWGLVRGVMDLQGVHRFASGGTLKGLWVGEAGEAGDEGVAGAARKPAQPEYERRGEKSVIPLHAVFAWHRGYCRWVMQPEAERVSLRGEAEGLIRKSVEGVNRVRLYVEKMNVGLRLGKKPASSVSLPGFGVGDLVRYMRPVSYERAYAAACLVRADRDWSVSTGGLRRVLAAGRPPDIGPFDSVRFSEWRGLVSTLREAWCGPFEYWRGRVLRAGRRVSRAEKLMARVLVEEARRYWWRREWSFSYPVSGYGAAWCGGSFNSRY